MLWLPDRLNVRWRLPLSDFSAAALLSVKGTSGEPALAVVRGALEHDAALCLWALCNSAADGHDGLDTVDALAHWLVANHGRVLVWAGGGEETPDDPAWRDCHRRLAAVSLAVALRARQLAGEAHDLAPRAFLLGLVHLAPRWWTLACEPLADGRAPARRNGTESVPYTCEPLPDGTAQVRRNGTESVPYTCERLRDGAALPALPKWLCEALAELSSIAPDRGAPLIRCVAQAREECDEAAALAEYDRLTAAGPLAVSALTSAARCLPLLAGAISLEQQVAAAKLAALAEFAAGAGHEINNPIAVICGRAQLLLDGETNRQRRHELAVINSQAMRVYEMISDMMLFARPPEPKLAPCDIVAVAQRVIDELAAIADERRVTICFRHDGGPSTIEADAAQLAVVVRALCENALAAAPRGGQVSITVETPSTTAAEAQTISLSVADNGPGIAENMREHLFDPFFSGREAGRGLGMGLAKAWRIINHHGGRIEVRSSRGEGARFTIVLPAYVY